jgi:four helix bundle suffix protein
MTICLIHQTTYLLRKQVEHLGELFLKEGGLRERMTRRRLEERNK